MTTADDVQASVQPLVIFEFHPNAQRACVEWLLSRLAAKDYRGGAELEVTPLNSAVSVDSPGAGFEMTETWIVVEDV